MRVVNIKTSKIIPYENNPRHNDEAVEYVANSIKEFGFKVPIIIDKNNVVVTGHTRLKAAKELGLETVPCIRADDLTEDQVKAFRIADNKVGEIATWDLGKLEIELVDIDMDMSDFGLDFDFTEPEIEEDEDEWRDKERIRTNNTYNLDLVDFDNSTGDFWQMPIIKNDGYIPDDLLSFKYAMTSKRKDVGIHFYTDDYQFERLWKDPEKYVEILAEYDCIMSPDFSLYMDMPMPMKIWNVYRSRQIGAFYQSRGLRVIPTMQWAEPATYEFCFRGIPKGSIVSVSTVGVKRDRDATEVWKDGMREMIRQVEPSVILVYGAEIEFSCDGIDVRYYENRWKDEWDKRNGGYLEQPDA